MASNSEEREAFLEGLLEGIKERMKEEPDPDDITSPLFPPQDLGVGKPRKVEFLNTKSREAFMKLAKALGTRPSLEFVLLGAAMEAFGHNAENLMDEIRSLREAYRASEARAESLKAALNGRAR